MTKEEAIEVLRDIVSKPMLYSNHIIDACRIALVSLEAENERLPDDITQRIRGNSGRYDPSRVVNDKIKNTFKSTKLEPLDGMEFTYELQRRIREDEDNFIFETIEPFCSDIAQQKISKQDLNEAIQLWIAVKRVMHKEEER